MRFCVFRFKIFCGQKDTTDEISKTQYAWAKLYSNNADERINKFDSNFCMHTQLN